MKLTQRQLEGFKTNHFVTIDPFFDRDEVSALQAEMERLKHAGHFRNVATDQDGKTASRTNVNLQLFGLYEFSPLVRALPFDSKVLEIVSQLIGDPVVFQHDQCFLKTGRQGSGTNWHQDNAYETTTTDPFGGVALWIAVHDATVANGTLHVIPGMAGERLKHVRDPQSNHHIRCFPDESRATPCVLKGRRRGLLQSRHAALHPRQRDEQGPRRHRHPFCARRFRVADSQVSRRASIPDWTSGQRRHERIRRSCRRNMAGRSGADAQRIAGFQRKELGNQLPPFDCRS